VPEDVADVGQRNADVLRRFPRTVGRSRVIRIRPGYALGTVKLTLIMIYFAKATTKCQPIWRV
jgi:hypothetical protein